MSPNEGVNELKDERIFWRIERRASLLLGRTRPRVLKEGRGQSFNVVPLPRAAHSCTPFRSLSADSSSQGPLVGVESAGKLPLKERHTMFLAFDVAT